MRMKRFMVLAVMSPWWLCAFLEAAECPLDHLIIGCNRDGIPGTADDRELFVDGLQKYRHSGDVEYEHWYYLVQDAGVSGYRFRLGEPGLDVFQSTDAQTERTYDPNRSLVGEANLDYRIMVECLTISDGLRIVHEDAPSFVIAAAGERFNHSAFVDGHVHLSYQTVDDTSLHWITMRLTDVLDDGDRYQPSEPFRVVFNVEPETGDLWVDGVLDGLDLSELSHYWLWPGSSRHNDYWERADADRNGAVDIVDFALLAQNWGSSRLAPPDAEWKWIETGFNYILMDIEFPEGQSRIGYAVGESLTYRGEGIVIKTIDGGDTWMQLTLEKIPGLEAMSFVDLQTGYAAGWDNYIVRTTDGGATWETVSVPMEMEVVTDIEFWDPNHGVLFEGGNVHVTDDGGRTWVKGAGLTRLCHQVTFVDGRTLFAVGTDGYIFKSIDGGYVWTTVYEGIRKQPLLGVDFLNVDFGIAVGDYSTVMSTMDGGETWHRISLPGDLLLGSVFLLDRDTAYLCGTPEYVFKTVDGGATWTSDYDGNWQKAFHRIRFTPDGTGFICGSGGVVLRKAAHISPGHCD